MFLQRFGIDEKLHAQITPYRGLAFGFRQPPHRVDIVRLYPVEIVFGLSVNRAEDSVGVGLAVNVRDAPVIADDRNVAGLPLPPLEIGVLPNSRCAEPGLECDRENETQYQSFHHSSRRVRDPFLK
jgi:hypothetical protein